MEMKNFNDLEFIEHPSTFGGGFAKMMFENNYGILVYDGKFGHYEIDVLDSNGNQTYNTIVTKDTITNANVNKINEIMEQIQKL
jgi:hypothetical protein